MKATKLRKCGVIGIGAVIVIVALICSVYASEKTFGRDTWPIGTIVPMTGPGAVYGKYMTYGQQLAIDEINASEEFPFKFKLIIEDHKTGDVKAGISAARKFIDVYDMPWINPSWANVVVAINPICAERKVVQFSGGGADPKQLNKPYLHNSRPRNDQFIYPMLRYMKEEQNVKRIAIMHNVTPAGVSMRNASYWLSKDLGVEVACIIGFEEGATDYRSGVAKIRAAKPDGVWIGTWCEDVGYIAKQLREMKVNVPLGGGCGIPKEAVPIAGDAMEGMHVCIEHFDLEAKLPWTQAFVRNYRERFKEDPTNSSANYYEAIYILKDCLKHVMAKGKDPWNGEELEKAIQEIRVFKSLYGDGRMELTPDGGCKRPLAIFRFNFSKNEWKPIKAIEPIPSRTYPDPTD